MESYAFGARPILQVTFRDEAGTLVAPTSVTFAFQRPDGTEVVNQAPTSNPSLGVYRFVLPVCNQAGRWTWRAKGSGPTVFEAPDEGTFTIRATRFANP